MNKIGRDGAVMLQTELTGAPWKILPAMVNFGKVRKFWEPTARLVGCCDSYLASSLCGPTQWSEKLLFFTM